jgi:hypothetical protein
MLLWTALVAVHFGTLKVLGFPPFDITVWSCFLVIAVTCRALFRSNGALFASQIMISIGLVMVLFSCPECSTFYLSEDFLPPFWQIVFVSFGVGAIIGWVMSTLVELASRGVNRLDRLIETKKGRESD